MCVLYMTVPDSCYCCLNQAFLIRTRGRKSQKQCDRCGRRNGCTGKKGTCPAWGKECGICRGKNHYKAVCRKAAQMQAGGGAQPKFQKQGTTSNSVTSEPSVSLSLGVQRVNSVPRRRCQSHAFTPLQSHIPLSV